MSFVCHILQNENADKNVMQKKKMRKNKKKNNEREATTKTKRVMSSCLCRVLFT